MHCCLIFEQDNTLSMRIIVLIGCLLYLIHTAQSNIRYDPERSDETEDEYSDDEEKDEEKSCECK